MVIASSIAGMHQLDANGFFKKPLLTLANRPGVLPATSEKIAGALLIEGFFGYADSRTTRLPASSQQSEQTEAAHEGRRRLGNCGERKIVDCDMMVGAAVIQIHKANP
jgi:hypothetical protein